MTTLVKRQTNRPRNFFEEFFNENPDNPFSLMPSRGFRIPECTANSSFAPSVDVHETDDSLIFNAELPGMLEKDFEVTVEKNVLTLKGERKFESEEKSDNYHRVERNYGTFQRAFSLPNNVNTDDVQANYTDGVLEIKFAKKAETKPKRIEISLNK